MSTAAEPSASIAIRPVTPDDAAELQTVLLESWESLRPWMPRREPSWFSLAQRRAETARDADDHQRGAGWYFVVTVDGHIVGRVSLSNVVRAAWQNATIGYWIAQRASGRGYASAAVRMAVSHAFDDGLHRVQAAVMPRNAASLRVVAKCGFRHEGLALRYLHIDGAWEDHEIFAVTAEEWPPQAG